LTERLNQNPEVVGATVAYSYPGLDAWTIPWRTRAMEMPESGQLPWATYAGVMNNFGDVLGLDLLRGRWFDSREHAESEPVVIVDQRFAQEAFPDRDPIGQEIQILLGEAEDAASRWHTIVGVTEATTMDALDDPERPSVFVPLVQVPQRFLTVAVDTRGAPLAFSQTLRETVRAIDADIPVYWVRTLDDWIWAGNFTSRIVSTLFGIFAFVAVALSAAGIYSVLAYSVAQRTREIGVRRALGALDGRILNMILGQGAWQLGIGLTVGLACAVLFARLLSAMLAGVSPFDPPTLLGVAAILLTVALLASLVPALRAMRVNPMEALRYE
jgi:putative ABC transport system permease protein